ncbi:MAG TPA: PspC domain-containing protein, partial [Egibacteraceae bacterium]|nr:PspC domain-containing protein [Egibacteraceae bacterium]
MTDHTTAPQGEDPTSTPPTDDDARERSSSIPPTDDARERQTAPPGAGTHHGPASPPPPSQRPLLRRDHDKHLAGVAGGLADYLGVDATLIRVAFAALTILGGIGIPLYLLGWVLLPLPSQPRSHAEQWFANAPNTAVVILVILGLLIVLSAVTDGPGGNGIGWGLALLFGGWLLFRADSRASYAGAAPPVETNAPPHSAWHGAGGTAEHAAPAPAPWVPPRPRPRSILGRLTVGLALAAVGVAALFEQLGVMDWQPAQYVGLALTVTGVGLVVGAWAG